MSSLISCIAWVRRGVGAEHPTKYNLDEKELERISSLARIELEDARIELERASNAAKSMGRGADDEDEDEGEDGDEGEDVKDNQQGENEREDRMDEDVSSPIHPDPNDLSAYRLDEYDNETTDAAPGPFRNINGLTYYRTNEEDPYITLKDDDEDEREELQVLASDNLLVTAKTEDEISQLEIYVYDESQENLYVHHDLMLPSFPLCLEWLDFHPAGPPSNALSTGNYIAVGMMEPEIEIWSLDMLETIYPASVLGRPDLSKAHTPIPLGTGKKRRKKTKARALSSAYHVDAVLGLSWNKSHRNLLASASADTTVKLWDLTRSSGGQGNEEAKGALRSFRVHKDKVQSVQWNDKEPTVILTGSYDRTVRTFDSRAPEKGLVAMLGSDVEALRWDPWDSHSFYVSLENGLVLNYDARTLPSDDSSLSRPRFTLAAHDGATPALDVNPHIRGCLVTGGTDKLVKVWNVVGCEVEGDEAKPEVSLVTSRDLGVGKVFSAVFSPDDPLTIAAAGSKAKLQIWDVGATAGAQMTFGGRYTETSPAWKERTNGGVIGVASDNEDESGEDG